MNANRPNFASYPAPPVGFTEAIRRGLTVWTVKGRISRSEYWYFVLFNFLVSFGLQLLTVIPPLTIVANIVQILVALVFFAISIKLGIRRYHDTGRSGVKLVAKLAASTLLSIISLFMFVSASEELGGNIYVANDGLFGVGLLLFMASLSIGIWMIVILALRGKPERNQFD